MPDLRPLLLLFLIVPLTGQGARDQAAQCDDAARIAAAGSDVPLDILRAITRVETGRGTPLMPWPWTLNQGGDGAWFDTPDQALSAAQGILDQGMTNLDIGCFQLNHRWHGTAFASLDAMFDPQANAAYAARFLSDLHRDTGDWPAAVAAYHSRTPENAERYLARVETVMADLTDTPQPVEITRENTFPLLRAGARGAAGSLMPLQSSSRPLIGEP